MVRCRVESLIAARTHAHTHTRTHTHTHTPGAQMVMTDVSGATDRADALGKLSVAYGVGMVVGPPIGGEVGSDTREYGLCVVNCMYS